MTPRTAACQASLCFTISRNLLKFMSIESVMLSNHLILCYPLLLLPSVFSSIRIFSCKSALCIRWPKYWSFSFSISPSYKYLGLILFRIDWLDLLSVKGFSRVFYSIPVQKHKFFNAQPSLCLPKLVVVNFGRHYCKKPAVMLWFLTCVCIWELGCWWDIIIELLYEG